MGRDPFTSMFAIPPNGTKPKKPYCKFGIFFKGQENIKLCISPTYQILNLLQLTDIYEWCDSEGLDWLVDSFVTEPYYLSAMLLPHSIRSLAADRIEAHAKKKGQLTWAQEYGIPRVLEHLRNEKEFNERDFALFVEQTAAMDKIRKQKFSQSCPELYELLL